MTTTKQYVASVSFADVTKDELNVDLTEEDTLRKGYPKYSGAIHGITEQNDLAKLQACMALTIIFEFGKLDAMVDAIDDAVRFTGNGGIYQ